MKSEVKVLWSKPVSCGQVFSVGLQLVDVCATAIGTDAAKAAAVGAEKRMM
jgi:hypothetical protein